MSPEFNDTLRQLFLFFIIQLADSLRFSVLVCLSLYFSMSLRLPLSGHANKRGTPNLIIMLEQDCDIRLAQVDMPRYT